MQDFDISEDDLPLLDQKEERLNRQITFLNAKIETMPVKL